MGLERQFWVPDGAPPSEGAYVRYPFPALRATLAAEARAAGALVVGEDLGTVRRGFVQRMRRAGLLSTRVLYFERYPDGRWKPPGRYPHLAAASVTTHDLPTLKGFLAGHDIDWRARAGVLQGEQAERERRERALAVRALLKTLLRLGLLGSPNAGHAEVAAAAHAFVGRTPSALASASMEDLAGELEQPNLPGTVDEHPNWRRRLGADADTLLGSPLARGVLDALARERGGGSR